MKKQILKPKSYKMEENKRKNVKQKNKNSGYISEKQKFGRLQAIIKLTLQYKVFKWWEMA